ncbi:MAG: glycosyltransferase family 2 protein [Victivallales bacterium]
MNYSVLTACLNSERTIGRSIDSVLSQKIHPSEYIFVDGGSADATLRIIRENNFKTGFKIIDQKEKTGITGAWNLGLAEVKTDIVMILNSDDWYEPDAVSEILGAFEDNPDAGIVYGSIYFHKGRGKYLRNCRPLWMFPLMMPIAHPSCFVRKSVYDKLGFFDQEYSISADYEFLYRCYREGVKFCEIRKPLVNMELGGTANSNRAVARRETREIARRYCRFPILPELAYLARLVSDR